LAGRAYLARAESVHMAASPRFTHETDTTTG
jgi:hypothetical protein